MLSKFKGAIRSARRVVARSRAVLPVCVALLLCGGAGEVRADIVAPFWDEKPNITGHAPRAARRAARAATGEQEAAKRPRFKAKRYAARGDIDYDPRPARRSLSGGVSWSASSGCLNGTLRSLVNEIAGAYGRVTVNSTCRSRGHNARVGGARRSHHLTGDAVDFRVHGNVSGTLAYLRRHGSVGGIKHYGGGLIHADTGPRRSW